MLHPDHQSQLPIVDPNLEDLSLAQLADYVFQNKSCELVLKSILNKMLFADWEGTQQVINEAIINHSIVDEDSTLLDIKLKNV
jgi:hypothetical protein